MAGRRNLEFKARVDDLDAVRRAATALGARDEGAWRDIDTYFHVPRGRLKLRRTVGQPGGTLISYHRPDAPGSRPSDYELLHVAAADTLERILARTLGVRAVVAKQRHLLRYGSTRIHLDRVEGLGDFVELETLVALQREDEAAAEHAHVKQALSLESAEPVATSYGDLVG
ncbi:MAG: class IV adenylate cyclase [Sphaerobacter sp.]|nr:class IV adenylate cyclase [Sphaerobacter sp.]